jgi:hypothetical protein
MHSDPCFQIQLGAPPSPNATGNATSSTRRDALAGPGIVADNQYEDRDSETWVNKPTKRRCHDVEQDADNGSQEITENK